MVAIFAAVVLVTYRKLLPSEDEKYKIIIYKLVKFYHVLCQKRRLEAQADHKDIGSARKLLTQQFTTYCKFTKKIKSAI